MSDVLKWDTKIEPVASGYRWSVEVRRGESHVTETGFTATMRGSRRRIRRVMRRCGIRLKYRKRVG